MLILQLMLIFTIVWFFIKLKIILKPQCKIAKITHPENLPIPTCFLCDFASIFKSSILGSMFVLQQQSLNPTLQFVISFTPPNTLPPSSNTSNTTSTPPKHPRTFSPNPKKQRNQSRPIPHRFVTTRQLLDRSEALSGVGNTTYVTDYNMVNLFAWALIWFGVIFVVLWFFTFVWPMMFGRWLG